MTALRHEPDTHDCNRAGFRGARRTLIAALALCLGVIHAIPGESGSALGQVRSITPAEVTSSEPIGFVFEPNMSYRGEVAGVHDREVRQTGFVQLDVGGQDPMFGGFGMAVSGDGCRGLTVQTRPATTAVLREFIILDRCGGKQGSIGGVGSAYNIENSLALSHTGRFAAVQFDNSDDVGPRSNAVRIDTETLERVSMPMPGGWFAEAQYGIDISDDGRYIAVTIFNTKQMEVAVWDVQTGDVTFASAPSGPTGNWAAFPSISGDGNWVSFASSEPRGLGEVNTGPWVYVANRSSGAARLVSGADDVSFYSSLSRDGTQVAFSVHDPAPVVITIPSFTLPTITFPIITFPIITPPPDPSVVLRLPEGVAPEQVAPEQVAPEQVAPEQVAPNCDYSRSILDDIEFDCPPTRINVAFGGAAGLTGSFQTETVSLDANNRATGQHWQPSLSGNGRWVTWISDAGDALLGTPGGLNSLRHAFMRRRDPGLSVGGVNFGTVDASTNPADRTAVVRNTGRTSVSVDRIVPPSSPFSVSGGTCSIGASLPPGASCTVQIRFRPNGAVDSWNSTVRVEELGYDAIGASGRVVGASTTGTTIPPPDQGAGVPILTASPNPADFGTVDVGAASGAETITVTNIGDGTGVVGTTLGGPHPDDFFVAENNCLDEELEPGESCTMDVIFIPGGNGPREAILTASTPFGGVDVELVGQGVATVVLEADPPAVDYGQVKVGFSTPDTTVTITNVGNAAGVLNTVLAGPHTADFFVRVNNCVNTNLEPGASCTMDIAMFPRAGGNREATLTVSSGEAGVDVPLSGQGRFEPSLLASPQAVTERGITILIGQGFPANEPFTIEVRELDGAATTTVDVTSDDDGRFRTSFSPLGKLDLGAYVLVVDERPNVFEAIESPLVVVLPTFQPQGPTGPAFNNNLLVARG